MLEDLLGEEDLLIGDLILVEVLQGFRHDRDYDRARRFFDSLFLVNLGGPEIAVAAAMNFRLLRQLGITVRKTIDTIIATYCIENSLQLLYNDRDFDPFVINLGLQSVMGGE